MTDVITGVIISSLVFSSSAGVLSILLSPTQFLKVMQQEIGLGYVAIAKKYYAIGGIKIFFRGWKPYCIMQTISSFSFGASEHISTVILARIAPCSAVSEIIFRSVLGSIFETTSTIRSEMAEITKNKKEFVKCNTKISSIVLSIFMRNAIFWFGGVASYKISTINAMTYASSTMLAFVMGLLCAMVSIPLDAAATRACGTSDNNISLIESLKRSYAEGGFERLFAGSNIRMLQIALYTVDAEIMMKLLH